MPIEFDKTVDYALFNSPLEEFEPVEKPVEHRTDPLTGRSVRIVPEVFPRPQTESDVESMVGDGEDCFFCPDSVQEATPEYPQSLGGGRRSRGEATSFPNLFPYAKHSNVVVLTADHFRPIDDLGVTRLADGLACGLDYVRSVVEEDDCRFASINMNLLPSSGSSVFHPHMQAIADDHGTHRQVQISRSERKYAEERDSDFWQDLLQEERTGDRYVGRIGEVEWLAPFAPLGQFHIAGIVDTGERDDGVPAPGADVVEDIATGINNVLQYYADEGLNAFNFGLRLAPDESTSKSVVDIVARPAFERRYVNDAFYAQAIHHEAVVDVAPETYAPAVADRF